MLFSNLEFIEGLHKNYLESPESVPKEWREFFEEQEKSQNSETIQQSPKEVQVIKLINAYRARGHLISKTNPVRPRKPRQNDLELSYFQLSGADLDTEFECAKELSLNKTSLRNIIRHLKKTYCGSIGVEYRHIPNSKIRKWLYKAMEPIANQSHYTKAQKIQIFKD